MITYVAEKKVFKLDTDQTTYLIQIVDDEQFVGHVYYGKKLNHVPAGDLLRIEEHPKVPSVNNRDRLSFLDSFPMEYSTQGIGDFRESCLQVRTEAGFRGASLSYVSHEIKNGKGSIPGLPAAFGTEEECSSLILHCKDHVLDLDIDLCYGVFASCDVITRSVSVKNNGSQTLYVEKILSACLDMDNKEFEYINLHGSWARERHIQRNKVVRGRQEMGSFRGETSHQEHPFMALVTPNTTQETGEVYAMNLSYSGNFITLAENTQFDTIRMVTGIHPENFTWKLVSGDVFHAPEAVLTYSASGLGQMTRNLHDFYRNHMIRSPYKNQKRPILINNWEATYFDFTSEKLIAIAKEAKKAGIEMLVMDDGWFGNRYDDNRSLGDWYVNEEKIQGGLKKLVDAVNAEGLKFGIWFEPEMISPDSELYRKHPEWAIQIPNRTAGLCRNQYVLDFSRQDVLDYTYEQVASILRCANIEYVKWDMNRQLADMGSCCLAADCQGELFHRYVLGIYQLQERMLAEFPNLLLENCSGGGARFDGGMLYYSPQIWCSDDTDAIERLYIQEGTSLVYPLSTMGAHVSDCPNHTVGRVTPFETRGYVALAGTFGYELDITKIPEEDRALIPKQVEMYHQYNDLVREGDYYRIASYRENHFYDCYEVVSKDKKECLVTYVQVLNRPNYHSRRIFLQGLNPDSVYVCKETGKQYSGEELMYAGINVDAMWGDFQAKIIHFCAE